MRVGRVLTRHSVTSSQRAGGSRPALRFVAYLNQVSGRPEPARRVAEGTPRRRRVEHQIAAHAAHRRLAKARPVIATFAFKAGLDPPFLHSFPTRRSSDLRPTVRRVSQ